VQGIVRDAGKVEWSGEDLKGAEPEWGEARAIRIVPGDYLLSEVLIAEGLAREWTGTHGDWCA